MILAAGLGTRLLPFTAIRPKPLFPILNEPLLLLTIKRLQHLDCNPIVVNCHHLADQIIDAVAPFAGVHILQEGTILGTGGGIRSAVHLFRDEPILVTNGDIYHTVNIEAFYRFHQSSGSEVSLAMRDEPRFNSVEVISNKVVSFDNKESKHLLAFTGIHVINRDALFEIQKKGYSSIIDLYRQLLRQGSDISSKRVDEQYWTDMGTVPDYLRLHEKLLKGEVNCWSQTDTQPSGPFLLAKDVRSGPNLSMHDWACVGSATIGRDVVIERSVIWDGAVVRNGQIVKDTIIAPS